MLEMAAREMKDAARRNPQNGRKACRSHGSGRSDLADTGPSESEDLGGTRRFALFEFSRSEFHRADILVRFGQRLLAAFAKYQVVFNRISLGRAKVPESVSLPDVIIGMLLESKAGFHRDLQDVAPDGWRGFRTGTTPATTFLSGTSQRKFSKKLPGRSFARSFSSRALRNGPWRETLAAGTASPTGPSRSKSAPGSAP